MAVMRLQKSDDELLVSGASSENSVQGREETKEIQYSRDGFHSLEDTVREHVNKIKLDDGACEKPSNRKDIMKDLDGCMNPMEEMDVSKFIKSSAYHVMLDTAKNNCVTEFVRQYEEIVDGREIVDVSAVMSAREREENADSVMNLKAYFPEHLLDETQEKSASEKLEKVSKVQNTPSSEKNGPKKGTSNEDICMNTNMEMNIWKNVGKQSTSSKEIQKEINSSNSKNIEVSSNGIEMISMLREQESYECSSQELEENGDVFLFEKIMGSQGELRTHLPVLDEKIDTWVMDMWKTLKSKSTSSTSSTVKSGVAREAKEKEKEVLVSNTNDSSVNKIKASTPCPPSQINFLSNIPLNIPPVSEDIVDAEALELAGPFNACVVNTYPRSGVATFRLQGTTSRAFFFRNNVVGTTIPPVGTNIILENLERVTASQMTKKYKSTLNAKLVKVCVEETRLAITGRTGSILKYADSNTGFIEVTIPDQETLLSKFTKNEVKAGSIPEGKSLQKAWPPGTTVHFHGELIIKGKKREFVITHVWPQGRGAVSSKSTSEKKDSKTVEVEEKNVKIEKVSAHTGRVSQYLSSNHGLIDFRLGDLQLSANFRSAVCPGLPPGKSLIEQWPPATIVHFDGELLRSNDNVKFNVLKVWAGKRTVPVSIAPELPAGSVHVGEVTEFRPPAAFVVTLATPNVGVKVFVLSLYFRTAIDEPPLQKIVSVKEYVHLGQRVWVKVKRVSPNSKKDCEYIASDAWPEIEKKDVHKSKAEGLVKKVSKVKSTSMLNLTSSSHGLFTQNVCINKTGSSSTPLVTNHVIPAATAPATSVKGSTHQGLPHVQVSSIALEASSHPVTVVSESVNLSAVDSFPVVNTVPLPCNPFISSASGVSCQTPLAQCGNLPQELGIRRDVAFSSSHFPSTSGESAESDEMQRSVINNDPDGTKNASEFKVSVEAKSHGPPFIRPGTVQLPSGPISPLDLTSNMSELSALIRKNAPVSLNISADSSGANTAVLNKVCANAPVGSDSFIAPRISIERDSAIISKSASLNNLIGHNILAATFSRAQFGTLADCKGVPLQISSSSGTSHSSTTCDSNAPNRSEMSMMPNSHALSFSKADSRPIGHNDIPSPHSQSNMRNCQSENNTPDLILQRDVGMQSNCLQNPVILDNNKHLSLNGLGPQNVQKSSTSQNVSLSSTSPLTHNLVGKDLPRGSFAQVVSGTAALPKDGVSPSDTQSSHSSRSCDSRTPDLIGTLKRPLNHIESSNPSSEPFSRSFGNSMPSPLSQMNPQTYKNNDRTPNVPTQMLLPNQQRGTGMYPSFQHSVHPVNVVQQFSNVQSSQVIHGSPRPPQVFPSSSFLPFNPPPFVPPLFAGPNALHGSPLLFFPNPPLPSEGEGGGAGAGADGDGGGEGGAAARARVVLANAAAALLRVLAPADVHAHAHAEADAPLVVAHARGLYLCGVLLAGLDLTLVLAPGQELTVHFLKEDEKRLRSDASVNPSDPALQNCVYLSALWLGGAHFDSPTRQFAELATFCREHKVSDNVYHQLTQRLGQMLKHERGKQKSDSSDDEWDGDTKKRADEKPIPENTRGISDGNNVEEVCQKKSTLQDIHQRNESKATEQDTSDASQIEMLQQLKEVGPEEFLQIQLRNMTFSVLEESLRSVQEYFLNSLQENCSDPALYNLLALQTPAIVQDAAHNFILEMEKKEDLQKTPGTSILVDAMQETVLENAQIKDASELTVEEKEEKVKLSENESQKLDAAGGDKLDCRDLQKSLNAEIQKHAQELAVFRDEAYRLIENWKTSDSPPATPEELEFLQELSLLLDHRPEKPDDKTNKDAYALAHQLLKFWKVANFPLSPVAQRGLQRLQEALEVPGQKAEGKVTMENNVPDDAEGIREVEAALREVRDAFRDVKHVFEVQRCFRDLRECFREVRRAYRTREPRPRALPPCADAPAAAAAAAAAAALAAEALAQTKKRGHASSEVSGSRTPSPPGTPLHSQPKKKQQQKQCTTCNVMTGGMGEGALNPVDSASVSAAMVGDGNAAAVAEKTTEVPEAEVSKSFQSAATMTSDLESTTMTSTLDQAAQTISTGAVLALHLLPDE